MLRTAQLLPPTGPLTLGFDPSCFQDEPPACYRATWLLPGRDFHPLATASFELVQVINHPLQPTAGRTPVEWWKRGRPLDLSYGL